MEKEDNQLLRPILPLLILSALSVCYYFARVFVTGSDRFWFMNWNLVLAWLPLIAANSFRLSVGRKSWTSWQVLLPLIAWFLLLPNSFYLTSDFVHLSDSNEVSFVFDAVLLFSYALSGLALGCTSTYLVHKEVRRKLRGEQDWWVITCVLLLVSFAIYLGRYLGWNSWDVFLSPAGILSDIVDRVLDPLAYPNTFTTTALFFSLLVTCYVAFYVTIQQLRREQ